MQSHYSINVSLNGQHFFATAERSAISEETAKRVFQTLREKFPASEGYKVEVTHWEGSGRDVTLKLLRK